MKTGRGLLGDGEYETTGNVAFEISSLRSV